MFTGANNGRAEEALKLYSSVFPDGKFESLVRWAAGEGLAANEGQVKLGRSTLAGQELVAMDNAANHGFTFNEGLSLQVMCKDQAEVDHYWARLSEGGETGPCGWLKDPFGVSWQVVPTNINEWMNSKDEVARDRAFQAMMGMTKLDIAALEAAFHGK
jgi:predicted 3-demethylubiquinone-9 3-methyltransferase (glyoxalase superfamily)